MEDDDDRVVLQKKFHSNSRHTSSSSILRDAGKYGLEAGLEMDCSENSIDIVDNETNENVTEKSGLIFQSYSKRNLLMF